MYYTILKTYNGKINKHWLDTAQLEIVVDKQRRRGGNATWIQYNSMVIRGTFWHRCHMNGWFLSDFTVQWIYWRIYKKKISGIISMNLHGIEEFVELEMNRIFFYFVKGIFFCSASIWSQYTNGCIVEFHVETLVMLSKCHIIPHMKGGWKKCLLEQFRAGE